MYVSGQAVIGDNILISVVSLFSSSPGEFYCYKVGSSMEEWQFVEKEEKGVPYYYFDGRAACVDDSVYFLADCCLLVAYSVRFSGDGIIQSLSAPRIITRLHSPMFPEDRYTSCLVHLGNREFCVARTEFDLRSRSKVQYVTIITLKISESMEPVILSSDDCALNTDGLGYAQLTSLCFNSQRSQYDYKSECQTGLKDQSECFEDPCIYTHLQSMNIDPPKLESVPEGSQPAGKRVGSSTSVSGKRNKEIALI
ncbi:uncharacterized protein LOC132269141 [Cornus florida]|uniref:uncharacterized protein LOC132269141 n=1 Tax=Cornus florida TaxID=4283 RepID=UPI0028A1C0F0|nr:uncharacterized protein LOC132269141 [Cornus florida]